MNSSEVSAKNSINNKSSVFRIFLKSSKRLQVILISFLVLILISFGGFIFATVRQFTEKVPAVGGYIREAVVAGELMYFNPVLDRTDTSLGRENNLGEKKVIEMLFAPLYEARNFNSYQGGLVPVYDPVLLTNLPTWQDQEYKILRMELREDALWSDGSRITFDDVKYSFDQYKSPKANKFYSSRLAEIEIQKVENSDRIFDFVSKDTNPDMYNFLNFRPISKEFFDGLNIEGLSSSLKSLKPTIGSGRFVFPEGNVTNIYNNKSGDIESPIKKNGINSAVILIKNPFNNYQQNSKLEYYGLKRYDTLFTKDKQEFEDSLEEDSQKNNIDIFTRDYGSSNTISPNQIQDASKLLQHQSLTSNFLTLYFNLDNTQINFRNYTVNKGLRSYIVCMLEAYQDDSLNSFYSRVSSEDTSLPLELSSKYEKECPDNPQDLVINNEFGNYSIVENSGVKRLLLNGEEISGFRVIGFTDSIEILESLENFFRDEIGITITILSEENEVRDALSNRSYQIALLPNDVKGLDITNQFDQNSNNLIGVPPIDRVEGYNFQENLNKYRDSNFSDETAKAKLIEFFKNESAIYNLYQVRGEFNYSNKNILNMKDYLPEFYRGRQYVYYPPEHLYSKTKRIFRVSLD